MPIYVDNGGPVRRRRRRDQDRSRAGSLRHIDQNIETAYAHFYGLSYSTRSAANLVGEVEYTGSHRPQAVRSRRPQQARRARWSTWALAARRRVRTTQYTAFNTRGNRGRSQYNGVQFSLDSRRVAQHGPAVQRRVHATGSANDNLSSTFSDVATTTSTSGTSTRSTRCSTGATREFDVRHRLVAQRDLAGAVLQRGVTGVEARVPWRLAGGVSLHRADGLSVHGLRLHERLVALHARGGSGRHRHEAPTGGDAPATRTSSSCSTSRRSCRTPAATCTRCRATATSARIRRT